MSSTRAHGSSRESWKTTETWSGHGDLAGAGHVVVEPGERAQQRALAGAAAPEQGHELARRDVEVDAVEHARARRTTVEACGSQVSADAGRRRPGAGSAVSPPACVAMTAPSSR